MPIQILPQRQKEQSWGEILGTGLGQGLNTLIKHKVDEAGRLNALKKFQGMGFTPQAAEVLHYIQETDPKKQDALVKVLQGFGEGAYAQPQQAGSNQSNNITQQTESRPLFGKSAGDERAQAMRETATEKRLEPFLKGLSEDYNNSKLIYSKANAMLDNLKKNKKKIEKLRTIGSFISPESSLGKYWYSDPDVRKYIADGNALVTALASSRKGQPTNFKIRFEQLSKPELSQPIKAQEQLLEDLIKNAKNVFKTNKFIEAEQEKHNGRLPGNIREKLIGQGIEDIFEYGNNEQGQSEKFNAGEVLETMPNAAEFPTNKVLKAENGERYISDGKQWKKYKG